MCFCVYTFVHFLVNVIITTDTALHCNHLMCFLLKSFVFGMLEVSDFCIYNIFGH